MKEFLPILPEVFLALTLVFVVAGELTYHGEQVRLITATALAGLCGALMQTLITYQLGPAQAFNGAISIDGLSLFFKVVFILLAGLAVVAASHTKEIPSERRAEYSALVIASALASSLAAASADLLLAFLSLQFLNVLSYFLAGYGKRSAPSAEAAMKHLLFGAVSGALLLYGMAMLFASTHSLNMYEIHKALVATPLSRQEMLIIFMLLFMGLSFQMGAFPMYLWAPDVIEGAPTPASAVIAVGSRAAGFAVAIRLLVVVFAQTGASQVAQWQVLGAFDWTEIVAVVSGLTMLIGALLAFRQVGAKRMVACLVLVETGFLLMGLLVLDEVGVAALLYNLVIELFALVGIFYVLAFFFDEVHSDRLEDLKGILGRAVPECIGLVLFLACLVGIPPMPGFIGKFTLIGAAIRHDRPVLAILAVLAMALSTMAVARLSYSLIGDFKKSIAQGPLSPSVERKAFLMVLMVPILLTGVFADFVFEWAGRSLGFILW